MEYFEMFLSNVQQTSIWEGVAVVMGLLSVWLAKKENVWVFPVGIVNVLIYVKICFDARLYADMGINFIYFVMSIYGWYRWSRKDAQKNYDLPISQLSRKNGLIHILITAGLFVILSYVISNFTDSDVPYWDSLTTAIFIVAMFMMTKKKIENWVYYMVGNFISIPLYFSKGLVFSSFQFLVFFILAIMGYMEWRNKIDSVEKKVIANEC
ncbi:MAG: nicotinamide riboside transporter PnuC [Hyphomicrobiales bacterium]